MQFKHRFLSRRSKLKKKEVISILSFYLAKARQDLALAGQDLALVGQDLALTGQDLAIAGQEFFCPVQERSQVRARSYPAIARSCFHKYMYIFQDISLLYSLFSIQKNVNLFPRNLVIIILFLLKACRFKKFSNARSLNFKIVFYSSETGNISMEITCFDWKYQ